MQSEEKEFSNLTFLRISSIAIQNVANNFQPDFLSVQYIPQVIVLLWKRHYLLIRFPVIQFYLSQLILRIEIKFSFIEKHD